MSLANNPELDETRSVKLCLPMLLDSTGRIDNIPDRSLAIPQAPEQIAKKYTKILFFQRLPNPLRGPVASGPVLPGRPTPVPPLT